MRDYLLASGWTRVEAIDLVPNDGSAGLPRLAEQVRQAALHLQASAGGEKVDVVAFSMGALVTRYWLMRLDGKAVARRFVSISGPHHGTALAFLRANQGAAQMRPGSPLLSDLARDEGAWGGVEVVSLWTPFDLMIPPRPELAAGRRRPALVPGAGPPADAAGRAGAGGGGRLPARKAPGVPVRVALSGLALRPFRTGLPRRCQSPVLVRWPSLRVNEQAPPGPGRGDI